MITKYLILVDEQSQTKSLEQIKDVLKNDGFELIYEEYDPKTFQKREDDNALRFDKDAFTQKLQSLSYINRLDSIACDYNLVKDIVNGFEIIKIIKEIIPNYKKQIILYSANIDNVIGKIIAHGDLDTQKENLKRLINYKIEFVKRDGYDQEVIKHIKKEKPFDFDDELIKWFYSRKEDEFNYLFPKYQGKKFRDIAKYLESGTPDSIVFKKDLVEQIIAYLSKINGLE
jgi:hypothetical protein